MSLLRFNIINKRSNIRINHNIRTHFVININGSKAALIRVGKNAESEWITRQGGRKSYLDHIRSMYSHTWSTVLEISFDFSLLTQVAVNPICHDIELFGGKALDLRRLRFLYASFCRLN